MSFIITGSDGFIGGYLLKYFRKKGIKVFGTEFKVHDLCQLDVCKKIICKVDNDELMILHCASAPRKEATYSQEALTNNLTMFLNMVYVASETNSHMITFGSGSDVCRRSWNSELKEEDHIFNPPSANDLHSISKNYISRIVALSENKRLLQLRLFGVFGEGEDCRYKFISNTIAKLLLNIEVTIAKDRVFEYLDVDDVARLILLIYERIKATGEMNVSTNDINLASGTKISLKEIAMRICSKIGKSTTINTIEEGRDKGYGGCSKRFKRDFPEFIGTDFDESIDRLIKYMKLQKAVLPERDLKKDKYLEYAKKITNLI